MSKQKITWLQILQGWSMLLVVIGHVTLTGTFQNPETPVSSAIERIIYSFHMPLFMFISGFLFYLTRISREVACKEVVSDKLKRLGTPFLFFTGCTFAVKYAFAPFMKRPVELSVKQFLDCFLYPENNPLGEMWFVATLFIIMLSYPLLKYALSSAAGTIVALLGGVALYLFFPHGVTLLCLSNVAQMFIFFYLGILCCKYQTHRHLQSFTAFCVCLVLFLAIQFFPELSPLLSSLTGIAFSLSLCLNLVKVAPSLFSSFRDYTFQIFLMGIFPQIAIRIIYGRLPETTLSYAALYMASIIVALYAPVLVAKVVEKSRSKVLRRCFGL